jgi:CMP-N-acetylneuraminic acid synthetase
MKGRVRRCRSPTALNGAFYLIDRALLMAERTFFPDRTIGFVMAPERSANIDLIEDWQILNAMITQGYWTVEAYG